MIIKKFNQLFKFAKKSKLKASDGSTEGEYPFLTSSQVITKRTNNPQFFEECLVFGNGGSANVHYLNKPFATTSHCYVAEKLDKKINIKYVYYYLSGNLHILEKGFKGAGLKNISSKYIANLDIPILPIETQNKIVALLDKASALVQKREESIALLDELLRAQFLEMFGKANEQFDVWEDVQIKTLALDRKNSMRTGPFGSNLKHSEFVENGPVAVLGIDNAVKNSFEWKERRYITNEKYEDLKRYTVFPRDVIITIMGTVGRSAVIPDDIPVAINTKHLACISLDPEKCNPYYLAYSIHSNPYISYQMKAREKGAIMAGLNLTIIKELKLKDAPIELQNQFETIYHNIQAQKETLSQSKTELDNLYNSLLQRAFSGQLNFNVDIELDALLAVIDIEQNTEKQKYDVREFATVYGNRLLERMESQQFKTQMQYQQAKQVIFQMLKEGIVKQAYDENEEVVKLKLT
ncbi:restriction endonuclease subunit S [Tenacibaculum discolor]|uniref:Restriction endonuclease subunit S n=1 Tax=Tenacibaculum discolor TaxID=361581 RepID=A0A2G1BYW4_9FLAO|nr:restriction endonuclease subunit S [Tenacibaculum discolor]MDP2541334.1 restriction endonuclease subunit S [Tenacibaculum discolor]PHN99206.1 restriction endonuclease subunit S [Tenacibaculum discolor]PHO01595.1 restriction endonuclease subunit S [Rhodobacteraceae bacterium 4F10]